MRLSDAEVKHFMDLTKSDLIIQDPKAVLDGLGVPYKTVGYDSYNMNLRGEKTPSAFISLKNGRWLYKDFGNDQGGTIENIAMDYAGMSYKDALNYCLATYNLSNHLEVAIGKNQSQATYQKPQLTEEQKQNIQSVKEQNKQREVPHKISKVSEIREVISYQLAVDYLKSRGIEKIPINLKLITGEYTNRLGEIKKAFGVGVLTQNGTGADIHFLKQIGSLKTMSFGKKDISFFPNPQSSKIAVFESKMDYAAAYQQMPLDDVNVLIANSTSNASKVADILKNKNFESVMIFNQNDKSGYKFAIDLVQNSGIKEFKSIAYDVLAENKQDINDLILSGKNLRERVQDGNVEQFKSIFHTLSNKAEVQDFKYAGNRLTDQFTDTKKINTSNRN